MAAVPVFLGRALHTLVVPEHGDRGSGETPVHIGTFGMSPPVCALVLGTVSGLSLIFGAISGAYLSPVKDLHCAATMAFGAGSLLFAVTVELYAHALHQMAAGHIGFFSEMLVIVIGALCGAMFYLFMNRQLEHYMLSAAEAQEPDAQDSATEATPLVQGRAPENPNETEDEKKTRLRAKAKSMWKKVRTAVRFNSFCMQIKDKYTKGREKGILKLMDVYRERSATKASALLNEASSAAMAKEGDTPEQSHAKLVAMQLFLGLLVDGVPEAILMGFMAAEGHLTPVFIIALFFANFPEAFSSASLCASAGMPVWISLGMWTFLCLLVGSLASFACWALLTVYPGYAAGASMPIFVLICISAVEGLAGGAMISCISAVMLPDAYERQGKDPPLYMSSGFTCALGFLTSVLIKAITG